MAKILVLAKSGFGKTTSICGREKFGIRGLNPKETFIIQCINRNLPSKNFILTAPTAEGIMGGNRTQVSEIPGLERYTVVANLIKWLSSPKSPYKNIVIDDFNYLSQDFYMANAMKGGWDTPKQIGYGMGIIFDALQKVPEDKNLIALAHYEEYKDKNNESISYKFKSTGSMVDGYITPEGKFDIVLYGKSSWDEQNKKATKEFVTDFDGEYPAKDSLGVLDDCPLYIPNDLGYVVSKINAFYAK